MILGFVVHCLASHETCQQRVREEVRKALRKKGPDASVDSLTRSDMDGMMHLADVIREAQRLYPAAHLMLREIMVSLPPSLSTLSISFFFYYNVLRERNQKKEKKEIICTADI